LSFCSHPQCRVGPIRSFLFAFPDPSFFGLFFAGDCDGSLFSPFCVSFSPFVNQETVRPIPPFGYGIFQRYLLIIWFFLFSFLPFPPPPSSFSQRRDSGRICWNRSFCPAFFPPLHSRGACLPPVFSSPFFYIVCEPLVFLIPVLSVCFSRHGGHFFFLFVLPFFPLVLAPLALHRVAHFPCSVFICYPT